MRVRARCVWGRGYGLGEGSWGEQAVVRPDKALYLHLSVHSPPMHAHSGDIQRFTSNGIVLGSGAFLPTDMVVYCTGWVHCRDECKAVLYRADVLLHFGTMYCAEGVCVGVLLQYGCITQCTRWIGWEVGHGTCGQRAGQMAGNAINAGDASSSIQLQ